MTAIEHEWMIETRTVLERLITRPKISPRLLARPPFRFLHDVMIEIMNVTGYGVGMFPEELMDTTRTFVSLFLSFAPKL